MLVVMLNLVLIVGMIAVCFFLFQINEKLERLNQSGGLGSTKKTG
jgi:hypothetical protein